MMPVPNVVRKDNTIILNRLNHPKCVSDFIYNIRNCISHGYTDIRISSTAQMIYPNACVPISGIIQHYVDKDISFAFDLDEASYLCGSHFSQPLFFPDDADLDAAYAYPLDKIFKFDSYRQVAKLSQAYVDCISHLAVCEHGVIDSISWCISEVMDNVLTHSASKEGYVMAQFHPSTRHVAFCVYDAGIGIYTESIEEIMTKAFSRLVAIDSRRWIQFLLDILPRLDDVDFTKLSHMEQQMLNMFYTTVWQETIEDFGADEVWEKLYTLCDSPVMLQELIELLRYRLDEIDFLDVPAGLPYDCPLDVHCSYSRDQLLVALDFLKPKTLREGVKYFKDKKTDVLLITLNKADKDYSPTTLYNDYAISSSLFHWQSQSTTNADSATGQRYIHHKEQGGIVLLFVREFKQDACGAAPYTFLGTADYVSHQGSRPMNIVWRLHHEIPAKYLKKTMQVMG